MPERESVRTTAEAIGRITCIKTGEEIGLLYQWDNGETQAALHDGGQHQPPSYPAASGEPNTFDGSKSHIYGAKSFPSTN